MRCSRGGPGNVDDTTLIVAVVLVGEDDITLRMEGEDGEVVHGDEALSDASEQ